MLRITVLVALLLPMTVQAQNYPGMPDAAMHNRMLQMESCLENIDEAAMETLQARTQRLDAEIKALCAQGKRHEAQQKAVTFGQEMATDPTAQHMRRCGELMPGIVPDMTYTHEKDASAGHVCDQ